MNMMVAMGLALLLIGVLVSLAMLRIIRRKGERRGFPVITAESPQENQRSEIAGPAARR